MSKIDEYKTIQDELYEIFIKKNKDYGNTNLDTFGQIGIMIRLQDKINRYINVSKNNINLVEDETLDDTIKDLINYCYLFLIHK